MAVPEDAPAAVPDTHLNQPHVFRGGRIHVAARQRHTDVTALLGLVLHLPQLLASVAVVSLVAYAVDVLGGPPWWLLSAGWALSGVLAFHRPSERLMARRLFGLRHPAPHEAELLRTVWREVTARAGVDGTAYQLWVEDSDDLNAMATAGHVVGVTSHAMQQLHPSQLAAVLAHELGHHTRGHAWATLLAFWYALPGRIAWHLLMRLVDRIHDMTTGAMILSVGLLAAVVIASTVATYGLIFLPLVTPYLLAAVSRRSELRADEHAADLGFAPQLMAVLSQELDLDGHEAAGPADGPKPGKEAIIERLLDSHPDTHTRLHHLQAHLEKRR